MNKNYNSLYLLQEAIDCGIVDDIVDSVHEQIVATKRDKVLKIHPYAITPPSKKCERWQTSYKDVKGKRKNLKACTEEELINKLIPIYFSQTHIDKLTFAGLFEEWIEYKSAIANSPNTIRRHRQHYKKYFESSILHGMKIKHVDELLLEKECNRIIKEFNLTRKEWCNAKTILNGMYEYALHKKKYLTENPLSNIQILVKFRQVVRKTGKTETYNTEEVKNLNKFLDDCYAESGDTSFLAVKVNLLLGLRVGELVALKWTDIIDEKNIQIIREEIRDQTTNSYEVVEHTKTNKDRFVILVPKAFEILSKIEKQGEYIFMRDGERITSVRIATILRKYARYMDVPLKSSHKLRKTYASNLNASGVPLDCIREMLGHSNLSTTLGYIYNPLTEEETYNLVASAL